MTGTRGPAADGLDLAPGDIVPFDAEVTAGSAAVDESALTGESAPVVREAAPGRRAVLAGSRIESGWLRIRPLPTPLPASRGPVRGSAWWPVAALGAGAAATALAWFRGGPALLLGLVVLVPPYLLFTAAGGLVEARAAFWRAFRVLPATDDALARAARCDTLLLPSAAVDEQGRLAAVEFLPLPGVTVREVAAAAQMATALAEQTAVHSVYLLARRIPSRDVRVREPQCGPVPGVARAVALAGGEWPSAAAVLERAVAARGGRCLAVADGGRPLGLVELRAVRAGVTLEDARRAGIALRVLEDPDALGSAVSELRASGRHPAVAWGNGLAEILPRDATFVLAGTAWAASSPTALDLDGNPGKLPGLVLQARRLWRWARWGLGLAALTDAIRAGLAVAVLIWRLEGSAPPAGWGQALAAAVLGAMLAAAAAAVLGA
jgi:hypothetical protein